MSNPDLMAEKKQSSAISDADRRVWELLTDVPKLNIYAAYGCAAGNVFISGLGTIVSAFLGEGSLNKT